MTVGGGRIYELRMTRGRNYVALRFQTPRIRIEASRPRLLFSTKRRDDENEWRLIRIADPDIHYWQ